MTQAPLDSARPQSAAPSALKSGLIGANLICMASMALWAAGLPAADRIIPLLPGDQLAALRMICAAGFLLPLWMMIDGPKAVLSAPWLRGILVGSLIGLGTWFIILGQARSGPVTAAVISASMPVLGIGVEVLLDGRKLTRHLVIGMLLAILGGIVALDLRGGGLSLGLGALLCFLSISSFVIGSRLTVTRFPAQSQLGRVSLTVAGSAVALCLIAGVQTLFGLTTPPSFTPWGTTEWVALAIFAIGGLALSQLLWIISVARLGIGMSSLHINAAPFYVMIILAITGGGWIWSQAFGAALVGFGVVVAQGLLRKPSRQQK